MSHIAAYFKINFVIQNAFHVCHIERVKISRMTLFYVFVIPVIYVYCNAQCIEILSHKNVYGG